MRERIAAGSDYTKLVHWKHNEKQDKNNNRTSLHMCVSSPFQKQFTSMYKLKLQCGRQRAEISHEPPRKVVANCIWTSCACGTTYLEVLGS